MKAIANYRARLSQVTTLLRLKPFDTSRPEGRSQERHRRILLTTLASALGKLLQMVALLFSIKLTLRYLGAERYGLWMTLSSFTAMLSFTDLGLGLGLMNEVAAAHGREDRTEARRAVSSAFFLLVVVGALIGVSFVACYRFIDWPRAFNVKSALAAREVGPTLLVLVFCFAIAMPVSIVQRIQAGYQEGFETNLWICAGNLLAFGGLLIAVVLHASLPWLVLAMTGVPLAVTAANWVPAVFVRRPWLTPSLSATNTIAAKKILAAGMFFFVLQIAMAIGYQSDNLVISAILGPARVAEYAVVSRMFMFLPLIGSFVISPLWPAYTEAMSRKDTVWIDKTLKRSIRLGLLVNLPGTLVLLFLGKAVLRLWVGPVFDPSFALLLGWAVWAFLHAVGAPLAMFLNGLNRVRFQVICHSSMAIVNIIVSIILTKTVGVSGVIWGTNFAIVACVFIPMAFYVPRLLARLAKEHPVIPETPAALVASMSDASGEILP